MSEDSDLVTEIGQDKHEREDPQPIVRHGLVNRHLSIVVRRIQGTQSRVGVAATDVDAVSFAASQIFMWIEYMIF